jgi:hypothetical protein
MTHAESQELLLDLAYGELPPHVAAEVNEHLATCRDCQKERIEIGSVRASFAPLGKLEEPAAGFDDRVLAVARAEAQLEHDGNIGEVVDVSSSESAAGIEAAQIDAYATPVARPEVRRRPRWLLPVLAGSIAAAAGVAIVLGTGGQKPAGPAPADQYTIHVAPVPAVETKAAEQPAAPSVVAAAEQQPSAASRAVPPPATPAIPPARSTRRPAAAEEGSGGDLPTPAELALRDAANAAAAKRQPPVASQPAVTTQPPMAPAARPATVVPQASQDLQAGARQLPAAVSSAQDAGQLEQKAGSARRGGDYALAARLYREAADARSADASLAAWDLAHAVECLSAAGSFEEARTIRDVLERAYPSETSAFAAARRALREVEPVSPSRP